jgi:O-acetyl-ADP-ribose deacetylase (regulator of RNase III)
MAGTVISLLAASVFLVIGIVALALGLRRAMTGRRHALLAFAWLCIAIAVTLVIFSIFPESTATGTVLGISVGGAAAFVVVILLLAVRVQEKMSKLDDPEARLREKEDQIRSLSGELDALRQQFAPRSLAHQEVFHYESVDIIGKRIGIVTGDLRNVDFVDIWVNSENLDMQMSRYHEKSISGVIRYLGAERDDVGRVVQDLVADELGRKVDHGPVMAGTALWTTSGHLREANNVRWIIHVAAVQGEPGGGYRQISGIAQCARNTLQLAERLDADASGLSIIFPLLGAGAGGADSAPTALALATATVDYLASHPATKLGTVLFLAYTNRELTACQEALQKLGLQRSTSA